MYFTSQDTDILVIFPFHVLTSMITPHSERLLGGYLRTTSVYEGVTLLYHFVSSKDAMTVLRI